MAFDPEEQRSRYLDLLYLRSIEDLEASAEQAGAMNGDEYRILMGAATIRRLLFDGTPLADVLRKAYQLPSFEFQTGPVPTGYSFGEGYGGTVALFTSPARDRPASTRSLTIKEFRAAPAVGVLRGSQQLATASVQDLVKFAAHIDGGVHLGVARTDAERALLEMGHGHTTIYLGPIMRCALAALWPLTDAVRQQNRDRWLKGTL